MKTKNFFYSIMMLLAIVSCTEQNADLNLSGAIYGKVTDAMTGEMIQSATVTILPTGNSTTTGADGTFLFDDLEDDQYTLQVQKSNYSSNSKLISVKAGITSSGDITLAPISSTSKIELSTSVVTLSEEYESQSITINNIGNSGIATWEITEINADWLTIAPTSGNTGEGKYSTVIISADFSKISKTTTTNVIVNADGESVPLMIKATLGGTSTDPDPEPNPDPDPEPEPNPDPDPDPEPEPETNPNSTLNEGLFVYYTFEDNTDDQTETGLNAKVMGEISYTNNTVNGTKAVKFSKIEESYVHISYGCVDGEKMTVSFWANGLTDGNIFYAHNPNGTENAFCLAVYEGMLNYSCSWQSEGYATPFKHPSITDDWHMITLTSDRLSLLQAESNIYVDGEYWGSVQSDLLGSNLELYNGCESFQIGGDYKSLKAIAMSIDNFRVYDTRILSADEIKELYELESK